MAHLAKHTPQVTAAIAAVLLADQKEKDVSIEWDELPVGWSWDDQLKNFAVMGKKIPKTAPDWPSGLKPLPKQHPAPPKPRPLTQPRPHRPAQPTNGWEEESRRLK